MIKIKIPDIQLHRNETTFRPFLMISDYLRNVGLEFVFDGNDYDMLWLGQATFVDKSLSLSDAISKGIDKVNKLKVDDRPVWLFDGQDSASLIGAFDVLKNTDADLLLKNSVYANLHDYSLASPNGRLYWDSLKFEEYLYSIPTHGYCPSFDKIHLSGANWLSTINVSWLDYRHLSKDIDVFAIFQYPAKDNFEFGRKTSRCYDDHREKCVNWLQMLHRFNPKLKIAMLDQGQRVSAEEYYQQMMRSKIVIAPFGYGEMAPRDIESAVFGAILVKPQMGHIQTLPNIYVDGTYCPVDWEFYSMNEIILELLTKFNQYQGMYVNAMRNEYTKQYAPANLVNHIHSLISKQPQFSCE